MVPTSAAQLDPLPAGWQVAVGDLMIQANSSPVLASERRRRPSGRWQFATSRTAYSSMAESEVITSLRVAAERVGPTILPIGSRRDGRGVKAEGSGFLLDVAGTRVLATAAHVLRDSPGPRYLFGPDARVQLRNAWEIRADPGPHPDLDLAFVVPDPDDLAQIGAVKTLPFGRDIVVPPVNSSAPVTCFGLPVSHTRSRGAGTKLHGSMTVLTGPALDSEELLQTTQYHPDTHFAFDYNPEAVPHEDGTLRKGRKLTGMSGGPVFLPQAMRVDGRPLTILHLVGVLIGGHGSRSVPTATRIGVLAAGLEKHGLASLQDLPEGVFPMAPPSVSLIPLKLT